MRSFCRQKHRCNWSPFRIAEVQIHSGFHLIWFEKVYDRMVIVINFSSNFCWRRGGTGAWKIRAELKV